jgi:hypothetical protein
MPTVLPAKYQELLSLGYFQTSFFTLIRRLFSPAGERATYFEWEIGDIAMGSTMMADGSFIFPERAQNRGDLEKVRAQAITYGEQPVGIPATVDPRSGELLSAFIVALKESGCKVVLFLPPYHPKTYEMLASSERYKTIVGVEAYVEDLGRKLGVTVLGSYNPAGLSLDETSFIDGSHATEDAMRKVFDGHVPGVASPLPVESGVELLGISNPNGFEVVNKRPFFWIGGGNTYINLRSSRPGVVVLTLNCEPGPSLPETRDRRLLITAPPGFSETLKIDEYPNASFAVPVREGITQICFQPLDTPTAAVLPNSDSRQLLIGVSEVRPELVPAKRQ